MSEPKFATSAEASKAGWFSRRHQTSEPHMQAQRTREAKLKQKAVVIAASIASQEAAKERKKKAKEEK